MAEKFIKTLRDNFTLSDIMTKNFANIIIVNDRNLLK